MNDTKEDIEQSSIIIHILLYFEIQKYSRAAKTPESNCLCLFVSTGCATASHPLFKSRPGHAQIIPSLWLTWKDDLGLHHMRILIGSM